MPHIHDTDTADAAFDAFGELAVYTPMIGPPVSVLVIPEYNAEIIGDASQNLEKRTLIHLDLQSGIEPKRGDQVTFDDQDWIVDFVSDRNATMATIVLR